MLRSRATSRLQLLEALMACTLYCTVLYYTTGRSRGRKEEEAKSRYWEGSVAESELAHHTSLLADPETGRDQQVASLAILLGMKVMVAHPCTIMNTIHTK